MSPFIYEKLEIEEVFTWLHISMELQEAFVRNLN